MQCPVPGYPKGATVEVSLYEHSGTGTEKHIIANFPVHPSTHKMFIVKFVHVPNLENVQTFPAWHGLPSFVKGIAYRHCGLLTTIGKGFYSATRTLTIIEIPNV